MPGAYLAGNRIGSGATITASSEDSAYPIENLYDKQAAKVFRSESLTTLSLTVDLGSALACDTIALVNHNLTSGATLSLKAGGANPPSTVVATPVYREHDIWKGFISAAARYWLLEITDSNPDPIEIGQFLLGVRVAFPRARRIGESYKPSTQRATISGETYAGVFWNYHLHQRKTFNPSFRVGSAAELAVLSALDQAVYGNLWPFLYIPNQSASDCYYVRKEESFDPQEVERISGGELVHDYQMTLVEESRGLDIQA